MRNINLAQLSANLFAALMLFLAGISSWVLLDLPLAGAGFCAAGLIFVTLAFMPPRKEQGQ